MSYKYKNIEITKFLQSGFLIEFAGKKIYIDPFQLPSGLPKADYVLLTHEHYDHADPESINSILQDKTVIVANELATQAILETVEFDDLVNVAPDMRLEFPDFLMETVPAYCLDKFHDKERKIPYHAREKDGVGFVLHFGDTVVYHAGDTDNIPELGDLEGIDVMMFPISGKYVATSEEAAQAVLSVQPKLVVPMHHDAGIVGGEESVVAFKEALSEFKGEIYEFRDIPTKI